MDMTVAAQSGFMSWFSQYGQVVYIFTQMAFWVVLAAAGVFAATKYAQYVDFTTGKKAEKKAAPKAEKKAENVAEALREADAEFGE